ncbi:MAG: helix-turn-helix domain-containing protein [Candidatus Heimdallarchaeota archaeon]|jgi:DNA-binding HxlR family transcriptional regulator|tara:strand:- start:130 stop:456 length:327 start_codon:yes stop_codon:yes gene_type:complete
MKDDYCPIHSVTKLIGGKWKMPLMYIIQSGPKRFGELRRILSPITEQMLTKQLRELEGHNLISRNDFQTIPPRVEYSLTDFGKSLSGIINQYQNFGEKNKKQIIKLIS